MTKQKDLTELLTIQEAAHIIKVSTETLRRWDNKGILRAVRIGNRKDRRYRVQDVEDYIKQRGQKSKKRLPLVIRRTEN